MSAGAQAGVVPMGVISLIPVSGIAATELVDVAHGLDGMCFAGVTPWLLWSLLPGVKPWEWKIPNALFLGAHLGHAQPTAVGVLGHKR